jgi:hypothetical protein
MQLLINIVVDRSFGCLNYLKLIYRGNPNLKRKKKQGDIEVYKTVQSYQVFVTEVKMKS